MCIRDSAEAIRIVVGGALELGVAHRLHGRGDRVLREEVGALGFLAFHVHKRIEVLHLARELHRERPRIELRDRARTGTSLEEGLPGRRHVVADGRDGPEASDDDPALTHADLDLRYVSASPTVRSFSASSSGMSMLNSFSNSITSSTVSRLSAPRSSMKLASFVSFSRSTPSSLAMISFTFSSRSAMDVVPLNELCAPLRETCYRKLHH